jgi:hypothetical protein
LSESAVDPRLDKARITAMAGNPLAPSQYDSILASLAFKKWRRQWQTTQRRLWVKGEHGSGKTTQICSIIDDFQHNDAGVVLSYFFCNGSDARRNTAEAVLRGLIYLLIQQLPALAKHTTGKKYKREIAKSRWVALSRAFSSILRDVATKYRRVCLVVDGLDECETDLPKLLDLIVQASPPSSTGVKWIVSSHDSAPSIIADEGTTMEVCLDSSSDTAVTAYMIKHTARQNQYDVEAEAALASALAGSSPLIRTAMICRSLAGMAVHNAVAYVMACPVDTGALYAHVLQKLDESGRGDMCRRLLAVLAVIRRPLMLSELAAFFNEGAAERPGRLAETLEQCRAFLAVYDDIVYFTHASAKEFLYSWKSSDDVIAATVKEASLGIFSKSLERMSLALRRDMYDLRRPDITIDKIQPPDTSPLVALQYACVHWVDHLLDAQPASNDDAGALIDVFLRTKYLYWLEALGLLGHVSEGVRAMENLVEFVVSSPGPPHPFFPPSHRESCFPCPFMNTALEIATNRPRLAIDCKVPCISQNLSSTPTSL